MAAHLRDTPPEVPGLAEPLRALLARMLDKAREKRPSADDVAIALEKYLQAPPAAAPPSRWARGLWALVALFFVCAAVLMFRVREGTIVIEGIPENAEVFVDGDRATVRVRPDGKSFEVRAVPGKRRVEVRTGDVVVYGKELDVALGRGDPIRVRIEPSPAPVAPPPEPPRPQESQPKEPQGKESPAESQPSDTSVVVTPGAVWKGWRRYEAGVYFPERVTYSLHVRERNGDSFVGHSFSNGEATNRAEVKGRIKGNSLTWEETPTNSPATLTFQGTLVGGKLQIRFDGMAGQNVKTEGAGELRISRPPTDQPPRNAKPINPADKLQAGAAYFGYRNYQKGWYAGRSVSYLLQIYERNGETFSGRMVDNGRNPADLKGTIKGDTIAWRESVALPELYIDIEGKMIGDTIFLTFVGKHQNGSMTRTGDGELTFQPSRDDAKGEKGAKVSPPENAVGPLVPGSVWKGWRQYEEGAYAPKKVPCELHIRNRAGETFAGHTFDNGPNRNHAKVTGQIKDGVIRWEESPTYMPGKVTITGKHVGGGIEFKFDGQYGMNAATRGFGALTREVTDHADRIQAGAVFLGWRTDKSGADADKTVVVRP